MRVIAAFWFIGLVLISGCGYKEGVSISEQTSYLYFSGDTSTVMVSVNGGEKFSVKPGRDHQYKISPGTHTIRVYRGGAIVVERQVYVSDGVAKEIGVN